MLFRTFLGGSEEKPLKSQDSFCVKRDSEQATPE